MEKSENDFPLPSRDKIIAGDMKKISPYVNTVKANFPHRYF